MTRPLPSPPLAQALASLAERECRRAIRALADASDRHKGVHEARKSFRRLKSLLALGAGRFGDALDPLWTELSSLATGLSALRDAHVALAMAKTVAGDTPSATWRAVIGRLAARRDEKLERALRRDPAFAQRRQRLAELGVHIQALPWAALERDDIEKALAASERRVAKAETRAARHGTQANRHRWRRRARRLRMQLEFWRKALNMVDAPAHHRAHEDKLAAKRMSDLSDALGARQDLRALRKLLRTHEEPDVLPPLLQDVHHALKAAGH
ncbi:CHAD domain-containing protein [Luteibacter sp. PPL201]|uniref:CHAD domain-containing protein n=1 Tax=Luteibacter sahnii TaxID=3021977 RepID=A0ABT6B9M9_9GAMM|nr:CHAD domain-containing protein [Luteibacter sp. PPL193]MDY1549514.1 CHAD domain-containing protein [Luteibacter sp. PPL193]